MNLIEIYIQEVTRRLPEKNRGDIALELESTIADMLPDDPNEEEVKAVLGKLGNPVSLANGYQDRPMYLIGPRYFDVYVTLIKMFFPIAAAVSFIIVIAQFFIGYSGNEAVMDVVINLIGKGISKIIEVGIQVFFWLTLVFAVLERVDKGKDDQPLTSSLKKWKPDDLKNIPYIPKKKAISNFEVFMCFLWTAIAATVYFYADHLIGIYEGGRGELEFVIPAFNQEVLLRFWPIVVIMIALEIALSLYKLIKGRWTKRMALYTTVLQLIQTIAVIIILVTPNILNANFLSYMADLFNTTNDQFKTWILGGSIFLMIFGAAYNIYDAFRKASEK
ncbi:hypothetical protein DRW41_04855 [Neobacillus piezotolerans]|uniref:Uncharacterized protein n=1 Tax=Neobacillus piezotolerans TaxID=2259171 RepID=A0A3D8GXG1_9BACI|nr:hypothetical protein [Neobacillus piezotolerans]RDU38889.1 hypothetical protein DRW41_04855 [Neobacillus piezotolerans]